MPSLNLSSLSSQSSHHPSLTTEATLSVVFGICMAILATASLWLAWVQWRFQQRNNECESLTDMWQACKIYELTLGSGSPNSIREI